MKITEKENYKIIDAKGNDLSEFVQFFEKNHADFQNDNVVVNLLKKEDFDQKDLLEFLPISNEHRKNKRSFVIINDSINMLEVPGEIIVVPTLQEAEDIIQMEEIERDLGF